MIEFQQITQAHVYLRNALAGTLEKQSSTRFVFRYDPDYLASSAPLPIAQAFPLSDQAYTSTKLHPFFDNLILEGWLLSHAEKALHIDRKNRFALLMAVGRSPIGAISIHALATDGEEHSPVTLDSAGPRGSTILSEVTAPNGGGFCPACLKSAPPKKTYHPTCEKNLWSTTRTLKIELDEDDPLETFSQTIYGGSISGAQRKGLFTLDKKTGVLRAEAAHSLYILKPDGDRPELPANEHVTMTVAREAGFHVPPSALIRIPRLGDVFVVKRFDRTPSPLLMEDMAQLLGEESEDKYESSNEKVAKALQLYSSTPVLDRNDFFRRLLFCFLTGNGDMHLKNWSLLESASLNGEMEISPCYDFINTRLAIPRESIDIGLSLRGKKRNLQRSYFEKFAHEELESDPKFVRRVFEELPQWLGLIRDFVPRCYLSEKAKKRYLEIAEERFETLQIR